MKVARFDLAGLHGSVGLALVLSMDKELRNIGEARNGKLILLHVAVVTILTLTINAPTMSPLLRKLGLTATSQVTEQVEILYVSRRSRAAQGHSCVLVCILFARALAVCRIADKRLTLDSVDCVRADLVVQAYGHEDDTYPVWASIACSSIS